MTMHRTPILALLALAMLATSPGQVQAQMLKKMLDRAVEKVEQRLEKGAEDGADKAVDGVVCLVTDPDCVKAARGEDGAAVRSSSGPRSAAGPGDASVAGARPGEGAWGNFDFVTGDRVLFTEDFSADRVGNFPRRLEFRDGNLEVVDWEGGRYLRSTAKGSFDIVLPEALPERFTIEFDLYDPSFHPTFVYTVDPARNAEKHTRAFFAFNRESGLVVGKPANGRKSSVRAANDKPVMLRVSIMADGDYMKVFLDEKRVANVPSTDFPRGNRIRFEVPASTSVARPVLIGNITIAAGGTSLYDALASDGMVSVRGILFDSNSDRIRPDSSATLKQIGDMLRQHADLRLRIEGHTDNVGGAAANQALSERRAEAIRTHLVTSHGVDGGRLQSLGKGQGSPVGSNDTAEGRQNNRRVVLVKL